MPAKMPAKPEDLLQLPVVHQASSAAFPSFFEAGTHSYLSSKIAWADNSGEPSHSSPTSPILPRNPFRSQRQLVNLHKSFMSQLEGKRDALAGQSDYVLEEKMKLSAEPILACSPDRISLEITWDGSVFYKTIKNDLTIHFEHFLVDEFDDTDEAILIIYKGDAQVLAYGDNLKNTISEMARFLTAYKIAIPQLV